MAMSAFDIEDRRTCQEDVQQLLPSAHSPGSFSVLSAAWGIGFFGMLLAAAAVQVAIYSAYQHEEFIDLVSVVTVPGLMAYTMLVAYSQIAKGQHTSFSLYLRCFGVSLGSLVLLLVLYYVAAEGSLLPQHTFQVYAKALVVAGIPYFMGVLLFFAGQRMLPLQYQLQSQQTLASDWVWQLLLFGLFLLGLGLPMFTVGRGQAKWLLEETAAEIVRIAPNMSSSEFFTQAAGDWIFIDGEDGTLYTGFRLVPVPRENPECAKHIREGVAHPLGGEVEYCFIGLATRGPIKENLHAGRRFPRPLLPLESRNLEATFFIVASKVSEDLLSGSDRVSGKVADFAHILRFFPLLYDSKMYDWEEDYSTAMVEPADFAAKANKLAFHEIRGMRDLLGFLYLEDFRYLILDMMHGALHGCYCIGMIGLDKHGRMELRRYNRWSWDVLPSWTARKQVLQPEQLRGRRQQLLDGTPPS